MTKIKKMPDKKTLEAFIKGMSGDPQVYFDVNKGEFIWFKEKHA